MKYPSHLKLLIDVLKRLPGVGNKSAERFAFQILGWPSEHLHEFAQTLTGIPNHLRNCEDCGCLIGLEACSFCYERKDPYTLCIVASPKDAFIIEGTGEFRGFYHVLGGLLSPLEGIGPESLALEKLRARIEALSIKELVIALDSTLEGDATALYIKQELGPLHLQVSRLAFGLPMGSALDYVDGGTLGKALVGRRSF